MATCIFVKIFISNHREIQLSQQQILLNFERTPIPLRPQNANLSIPSCIALETFLNQKCSKCSKHSITFFQSKRFNCSQSGRLKSNSFLSVHQDIKFASLGLRGIDADGNWRASF